MRVSDARHFCASEASEARGVFLRFLFPLRWKARAGKAHVAVVVKTVLGSQKWGRCCTHFSRGFEWGLGCSLGVGLLTHGHVAAGAC